MNTSEALVGSLQAMMCFIVWLGLVGYACRMMWAETVLQRWHEVDHDEVHMDVDPSLRSDRHAIVPMSPTTSTRLLECEPPRAIQSESSSDYRHCDIVSQPTAP